MACHQYCILALHQFKMSPVHSFFQYKITEEDILPFLVVFFCLFVLFCFVLMADPYVWLLSLCSSSSEDDQGEPFSGICNPFFVVVLFFFS